MMVQATQKVEIGTLEPDQEAAYTDWLLKIDRSLVYYTPSYRRFLSLAVGGEGVTLLAKRGGEIVGAMPYFEKRHPKWGSVMNSLPWYGSHGGCIVSGSGADAARVALLEAFASLMRKANPLSATLILSPAETSLETRYQSLLQPSALDHRCGQITQLPANGEELEQKLEGVIRQKTRNLVRKARKQGFEELVTDDDWAWRFLHEQHVENISAVGGKAKPWAHFAALRKEIPSHGRRLSVAMHRGEAVSALLVLLFNRTVEYLTPAIKLEARPLQPLSFLIWQAMLEAIVNGFRWWSWGGTWTTQRSLHHFKEGWGAVDCPYTYIVCARTSLLHDLRENWSAATDAFPYYYLFPVGQLSDDPAQ